MKFMNSFFQKNNIKEAVILAGGKGTRLSSILQNNPKPMVPFEKVPLIHLQIEQLVKYGYNSINILTSYKSEIIKNYLTKNLDKKVNIHFYEDTKPLGTAGSFLSVLGKLSKHVLVVYGDTLFDINIEKFEKFHFSKKSASASIFLHPNTHPYDSDLVEMNDFHEVIKFHPYPHKANKWLPNMVNAAFYLINTKRLVNFQNIPKPSDFGKNLFPKMLKEKHKIFGYVSPEYIKDVGTPDRYAKALSDYRKNIPLLSNLKVKQKVIFLDRDGTINLLSRNNINNTKDFKIYDYVPEAIKLFNDSNFKVIVITNQPAIAKGQCDFNTLNKIHYKMESILGKSGAFVDRIYFCPHHPDSGFKGEVKSLKIRCQCRKPSTKLVKQAIHDFNIDVKNSWFIGDSSADILVAKKMGIKSILVNTGEAGLDYKFSVQPQYSSENLLSASKFILDEYNLLKIKLKKIISKITKKNEKIYFVSGYSKTGKSTVSQALKDQLLSANIVTEVFSLDRWLLPLNKRGNSVDSRYDIKAIIDFIKKINNQRKNTVKYSLPNYNKILNAPCTSKEVVPVNKNSILIFEGVIAGYIANIFPKSNNHIYLSRDNSLRKNAQMVDYKSRGLSRGKILTLLKNREPEELRFIQQYKNDSFIQLRV